MSEEEIKQYYERIEKLLNGANKKTYGFVPEEIRQILKWYEQLQQENEYLKEQIKGYRTTNEHLIDKNNYLKQESFMKCAINCNHLQKLKFQRDLYKSVIDEAREYIRKCCNMDGKFVNIHYSSAQNEMSADQVDNLLEILDKAKESE